ncbi:MAG: hypothetical protein JSW53_05710 [Candidatus Bathyarchaeota archaeon]|nr:MAG: hypothetical protein JSW53_05710 [Candidatus Bathyarchaeota archaeon]
MNFEKEENQEEETEKETAKAQEATEKIENRSVDARRTCPYLIRAQGL